VRLINKNNLIKRCTICFTDLTPKEVGSDIGNCYISNYKNKIYKCNSCFIFLKNSKTSKYRKEKTVGCSMHLQDLIKGARERAKKNDLPFNLKVKDLRKIITPYCPVFGFKFEINKKDVDNSWKNSPTLDRIIPEKGYVKNNIIIVSMLANTIKSCATPEQIFKVGNFYNQLYKEKGIKDEAK
jgi:hypothetical protein